MITTIEQARESRDKWQKCKKDHSRLELVLSTKDYVLVLDNNATMVRLNIEPSVDFKDDEQELCEIDLDSLDWYIGNSEGVENLLYAIGIPYEQC